MRATMLAAYRATGADPPWGDPRAYHGVGMEGYFWRITDARSGVVVVVLAAVNRDATERPWGLFALATHPGGLVRSAIGDVTWVGRAGAGLGLVGRDAHLRAVEDRLEVRIGDDAAAHATFAGRTSWPSRFAFGGIGAAQCLPGLSQYWHPYTLGGRVAGRVTAGENTFALDEATVYAEKNWGAGGHPPAWWWGQAHGFAREDVCVAFAGGEASLGRLRLPRATSIVVALGGEVLRLVSPVVPMRVDVGAGGWRLRARTSRHRIELEGHAGGSAPHVLPVPVPAERGRHVAQSAMHLAGTLRVRVRRGRRTLFAGESALAGLERGLGPVSRPPAPGPRPR